jgi:hypothetical protein
VAINRLVIASLEEAWQSRVWFCKGIFGQEALDRRAPLAMTTDWIAALRSQCPPPFVKSFFASNKTLLYSVRFLNAHAERDTAGR